MNCKPGDLAYIVRAVNHEMVGRIVLVVEWSEFFGGWVCEVQGDVPSYMKALIALGAPTWTYDDWLRPIGGVPVHDEQHDEVPA